jgi:O-antigen/teichoic acid export membrane protein
VSRLATRAFWGLASWALPLGIVFVVTPQLLHLLGAARFGVLMIALVTPALAVQFDLGIVSTGVRHIAAHTSDGRTRAGAVLPTLFLALGALGAALGVALWTAAPRVADLIGFTQALGHIEGERLVRVCATWLSISLAALVPGIVARALQEFRLIAVLQTINTLMLWLSALALLASGHSIEQVVWLAIALTIVMSGVTLVAVRHRISWSDAVLLDTSLLTREWRFSAGMFAAQAAGTLVYQADRIVVSALGSPAIAGLYALCVSVANKTAAAVGALTSFVYPHAARLVSAQSQSALAGLLHALDRAIAVLVVPIVVPAVLLAGPFLRLWIGSFATDEVIDSFRLLVIAFALPAFTVPISSMLAGKGEAGIPARFAWLTVVVIFVSLALLVPAYGLIGAALAMLLANLTAFLFLAVGRRALALPRASGRAPFWLGLGAGALCQLVLLYWIGRYATDWPSLLLIAAVSWSAFFGARVTLRALSPEERTLLTRVRSWLQSVGH